MSVRVPDVVGEIVAFRAWQVVGRPPRVSLQSVTTETVWPYRAWMVAHCDRCVTEEDLAEIPHERCSCGIYAARSREHLLEMHYNRPDRPYLDEDEEIVAIGEVGLAGKVIRGTQGWRGQRARPIRLWLPYEHWPYVEPLAAAYRIPVALDNTLEQLREAC